MYLIYLDPGSRRSCTDPAALTKREEVA